MPAKKTLHWLDFVVTNQRNYISGISNILEGFFIFYDSLAIKVIVLGFTWKHKIMQKKLPELYGFGLTIKMNYFHFKILMHIGVFFKLIWAIKPNSHFVFHWQTKKNTQFLFVWFFTLSFIYFCQIYFILNCFLWICMYLQGIIFFGIMRCYFH